MAGLVFFGFDGEIDELETAIKGYVCIFLVVFVSPREGAVDFGADVGHLLDEG